MNKVIDKTASVLMCLGLCGFAYKLFTGRISNKAINRVITTYHTGRMWFTGK